MITAPNRFAINVPLHFQDYAGYCGPACIQMAVQSISGKQDVSTDQAAIFAAIRSLNRSEAYYSAPMELAAVLNQQIQAAGGPIAVRYDVFVGESSRVKTELENTLFRKQGPAICLIDNDNHWAVAVDIKEVPLDDQNPVNPPTPWVIKYRDSTGPQEWEQNFPGWTPEDQPQDGPVHDLDSPQGTCNFCSGKSGAALSRGRAPLGPALEAEFEERFLFPGRTELAAYSTVIVQVAKADASTTTPSQSESPSSSEALAPECLDPVFHDLHPCPPCPPAGDAPGGCCAGGGSSPPPSSPGCHCDCCRPHAGENRCHCDDSKESPSLCSALAEYEESRAQEKADTEQCDDSDFVLSVQQFLLTALGEELELTFQWGRFVRTSLAALPKYWLMSFGGAPGDRRILVIVDASTRQVREFAVVGKDWPVYVNAADIKANADSITEGIIERVLKPKPGDPVPVPLFNIREVLFWRPGVECPNPYLPAYVVDVRVPGRAGLFTGYATPAVRRNPPKPPEVTWKFIPGFSPFHAGA